jgi:hypothetical protein
MDATRSRMIPALAMLCACWLAAAGAVQAQVLVYSMKQAKRLGFNVDFFDGGYFVMPAGGGSGSFLFTGKEDGRKVFVTGGTGTAFTGVTGSGELKTVVRAESASVATANSSYLAFGTAGRKTRLDTPTRVLQTRVAEKLAGEILATSTAADADNPKKVGALMVFKWSLKWDESLTRAANRKGNDVAQTIADLEDFLESKGFNGQVLPLGITTPASLPAAGAGSAYSVTLQANGGTAPRTWALASGSSLPGGLTLAAGGLLSGTPGASGTFTFTARVTDSATPAASASREFTLVVGEFPFVITTTSPLPDAELGVAYGQQMQASGGTGTLTWELADGNLPSGISLLGGGQLAGLPLELGLFTFTVRATDSASPPRTTTKAVSLLVRNP